MHPGIDYKTGANYSHKPNPLSVKLIPIDSDDSYQFQDPEALQEKSENVEAGFEGSEE